MQMIFCHHKCCVTLGRVKVFIIFPSIQTLCLGGCQRLVYAFQNSKNVDSVFDALHDRHAAVVQQSKYLARPKGQFHEMAAQISPSQVRLCRG